MQHSFYTISCGTWCFMLPDPNDAPTRGNQQFVRMAISLDIAVQLLLPPC